MGDRSDLLSFVDSQQSVQLVASFELPYDNAVAAARTCYSPRGVITPQEVGGHDIDDADQIAARRKRRDVLAKDLLKAGHHTVFQHAHFQFALSGISRHVTWAFLHSHPFYNSEQVSQRFVSVKGSDCVTPDLGQHTPALVEMYEAQFDAYKQLCDALWEPTKDAYFDRFAARAKAPEKWESAIRKRVQEIARYVLPVATTTYLYHTVSGITLMRYLRAARAGDLPSEQVGLVAAMIDALLTAEPAYASVLQQVLDADAFIQRPSSVEDAAAFDELLDGKLSKLVAHSPNNEQVLAQIAGWNLRGDSAGVGNELLQLLVDPSRNTLLGQNLNLTTHDKYSRVMHHAHYTFAKRLSHTADSQDQRHRMTPGSRPLFRAHKASDADYTTPRLIEVSAEAQSIYDSIMARTWEAGHQLLQRGVADEAVQYLMPNAANIRFYESGDLSAFRHKMEMRLCYNAQEEIWQASVDEAEQIAAVHPTIGACLLPPCTLRDMSGTKPVCPEGARFCGVKVWDLQRSQYERLL